MGGAWYLAVRCFRTCTGPALSGSSRGCLAVGFGKPCFPPSLSFAGLVWYAWFEGMVMPQLEKEAPEMTAGLTGMAGAASTAGQPAPAVPYKAFLGAKEVQALMLTHFCNNMWVKGLCVLVLHVRAWVHCVERGTRVLDGSL